MISDNPAGHIQYIDYFSILLSSEAVVGCTNVQRSHAQRDSKIVFVLDLNSYFAYPDVPFEKSPGIRLRVFFAGPEDQPIPLPLEQEHRYFFDYLPVQEEGKRLLSPSEFYDLFLEVDFASRFANQQKFLNSVCSISFTEGGFSFRTNSNTALHLHHVLLIREVK